MSCSLFTFELPCSAEILCCCAKRRVVPTRSGVLTKANIPAPRRLRRDIVLRLIHPPSSFLKDTRAAACNAVETRCTVSCIRGAIEKNARLRFVPESDETGESRRISTTASDNPATSQSRTCTERRARFAHWL